MKNFRLFPVLCFSLLALCAAANTYYVDINSPNPTPPYTSWSTAATNIQDAVNETVNGDLVLVNPGVYQSDGYVAPDGSLTAVVATNAITLQSANGSPETSVDGSNAMRCIYLANGATLTGFTLTNGAAGNGGGLYCASTNATVANCLLINNTATIGGGAYSGTLTNCTVTGNTCPPTGGNAGGAINSVLYNCTLSGNVTGGEFTGSTYGGGANNCFLINCTVSGNAAYGAGAAGGGAYNCRMFNCSVNGNHADYGPGGAYNSFMTNCIVSGNNSDYSGGGVTYGTLVNCILTGNFGNGYGGAAFQATLINCTICNYNYAQYGSGGCECTMYNCINYYNDGGNNDDNSLYYCCTPDATGTGCITTPPLFVNLSGNDFHLQSGSPCIDAGNNAYVTTLTDLGGGPRIIGSSVDMGVYEYQPPNFVAIEIQPTSQTVVGGQTATFSVDAVSPDPLNYQWLFNGTNIVDANGPNLVISDVQSNNAGFYSVMVSNTFVSVISSNVTLTVVYPLPAIVSQPTNQAVITGSNAAFSIVATNYYPLTFQWQLDGTNLVDGGQIVGSASSNLIISAAQAGNDGAYSVIVSDDYGSVTSSIVSLNVDDPVQITSQPSSQAILSGSNATLSVTATGTALNYQWFFNGARMADGGNISGSQTSTLTITNSTTSDTGTYFVLVTNLATSATSSNATLTVYNPAQITAQPVTIGVFQGNNASFTVAATGTALGYQWFFNGAPLEDGGQISGSATPVLNVTDVKYDNIGTYTVGVTNLLSATNSLPALLTIASVRYVNISNSTPESPYVTWSTAATNIQDAINISTNGDLIMVTNGVYGTNSEMLNSASVSITQPVTVESVNGPGVTTIEGYQVPGATNGPAAIRCVYMTANAALIGFTLTNGATAIGGNGGGVYCQSTACLVSNCVIVGNSAAGGGGAYQGSLFNCQIANNVVTTTSTGLGGGACLSYLADCTIESNSIYGFYAVGGGAFGGRLNNCIIVNNSVNGRVESVGGGASDSSLTNCAIAGNSAFGNGYGGGVASVEEDGIYGSLLINCTVTGNSAYTGGGVADSSSTNCIVYDNLSTVAGTSNDYGATFAYSCTAPLPTGPGNISTNPLLASIWQINSNSPCRGAGTAAVISGVDINGNPWANPPSIGCEEPYPGSMFGNITMSAAASATNIAVGYPINFQANISGPVYNSVWNFGDGTIVSNVPYISHTWAAIGNYSVTLSAYNDSYTNGVTVTNIITVYQPTVFYVVATNPAPIAPYDSWTKAGTNIQAAINVSIPGGLILVSNGVYNAGGGQKTIDGGTNRVAVTQPLTLQSVNGPTVTTIMGASTFRCVYLTNGAVLNGFTLAKGSSVNGGGIYATSTNVTITNCIIAYCSAGAGGGTYSGTFYNCSLLNNNASGDGGGAYGGAFDNCTIANNSAVNYGGGVYSQQGYPVTLENCIIVSNSTSSGSSAGGGVFNSPPTSSAPFFDCLTNCFLTNCVVSWNSARFYGSATVAAYLNNCTVNSNKTAAVAACAGYLVGCTLIGNQANAAEPAGPDFLNGNSEEVLSNCTLIANGAGASACSLYGCTIQNNGVGALYSTLVNCLIVSNTAAEDGPGANNCTLTNCTLTFNQATYGYYGGGAYQSTLQNCTLKSNQAFEGGGADDCTLNNCTLVANYTAPFGGGGGAAGSILNQCLIMQNIATNEGGGVMSCSLNNCLIISNTAALNTSQGGGAYNSTLTNCVLAFNVATNGGGAYLSTLVNCTLSENTALVGGGSFNSTNDNCILYYNNGGDYYPATAQYPLNYCCTLLSPGIGLRNITTPPFFVNLAGGDYHLQSSSPCVNSGNNAYITAPTDLDGNPRITGGTVDIGAYEHQTPTSVISYAYLQQYGLPTDGSVDFAHLNGTAFNVYQDWIAGLNPTNSASVLAMLTPVTTNTATGVTVIWQSVSGIPYFLQRSTNLLSQPPFTTIQSSITGQPNTTSYTDTSATNNIPYFYRVGVIAP